MENGSLSASDVALLSDKGYGDMWGGNSMMWIFALLILAGGGFGGFGGWGGRDMGYATSAEVQRGFDTQNLQSQTRDILAAVTGGTAQSVAATNQSFHDITAALSDKYTELQRDVAGLAVGQANLLAKENECCGATMRAIDGVNYNVTAQVQKVLDALAENRMADMQNEINRLQLQQAVAGVVRYPSASTYYAGSNPFCACGNTL